MASDLDTVRVLRALFNDLPHPPQGLTEGETMAWMKQTMQEFEGGEMAYTIEHITRNSIVDIVLRLREDAHLRDDAAFERTLQQVSTPQGRKTFMDWCIQAQKSSDATSRLLNRAKRSLLDPAPRFAVSAADVQRFIDRASTGPGPLVAEYLARLDVRGVGVYEEPPEQVYEFDWGFVVEEPAAWHVYVAEAWRKGTVGYFERFLQAWRMEVAAVPDRDVPAGRVPASLSVEPGIGSFSSLTLISTVHPLPDGLRQWVGEVFLGQMIGAMAGRAMEEDYDFPLDIPAGL
ncbi:MAG: hypothetical protein ACLGG8_10850 [Gammaproteobacteria bacterium]